MNLWLAVTPDEYELPIAVADTAAELGRMLGFKHNMISRILCLHKTGRFNNWTKYKIIKLEDIEFEE